MIIFTVDVCPVLTIPAHGMVTTTDGVTTYNSMATYTCNTGYNLNGDAMRTCGAGMGGVGVWTGSDSTCISKRVIHLTAQLSEVS